MKKKLAIFVTLSLLFISFLSVARLVFAAGFNIESGDSVVISDSIDGTLMTAGGNLRIEGDVNGPLFAAGETIVIEGNINGPIFVAGNTILINGKSEGEVFAAGNVIQINEQAELARDVFIAGSRLILSGTVGRDLFLGSGATHIQNEIGRDAYIGTNSLIFSDAGRIKGDLYYQSEKPAVNIDQYVAGKVDYTPIESQMSRRENRQRNYFFSFLRIIGSITSAVLIWLFLRRWTQNQWMVLSPHIVKRPLITLLIGLGTFLLAFVVILLGLLTVIFSNLAVFLAMAFFFVLFLSKIITASLISKYFMEKRLSFKQQNELLSFLIVYVLLYLGSMIPLVGWVIPLLCIFYAVGLTFQETMARV